MVSLRSRSPSKEASPSGSRSWHADARAQESEEDVPKRKRSSRHADERRAEAAPRRRKSSKKEKRDSLSPQTRIAFGIENEERMSPQTRRAFGLKVEDSPLRRRRRRRSSPKAARGAHPDERRERPRKSERDSRAADEPRRRRRPPSPDVVESNSDVEASNSGVEDSRSQKTAVRSGAAPKRSSRKGEVREVDSEKPAMHRAVRRLSLPDVEMRASESEKKDAQGRETFQERLRKKQMERSKKSEGEAQSADRQPDKDENEGEMDVDGAPLSAMEAAALAIKAVAASAKDRSKDKDKEEMQGQGLEKQEDDVEEHIERPLTIEERSRRCAERAKAIGLSCDFVYGRLIMPNGRVWTRSRSRSLSSPSPTTPGRRSANGTIQLIDPEKEAALNKATEAATSFADFIAARSRAAAAPPKVADVSEELKKKIEIAAVEREKKLKRKKKGRDYDYDPDLDGESMSSEEEQMCQEELGGDPFEKDDDLIDQYIEGRQSPPRIRLFVPDVPPDIFGLDGVDGTLS